MLQKGGSKRRYVRFVKGVKVVDDTPKAKGMPGYPQKQVPITHLWLNALDRNRRPSLTEDYGMEGPDHFEVGWLTKGEAEARYKRIAEMIRMSESRSIYDVGAGNGGLYEYLKEHDVDVEYIGGDVSEKFLKKFAKRFPEAKLEKKNFLKEDLGHKVDLVAAISVAPDFGTVRPKWRDLRAFVEHTMPFSERLWVMDFWDESVYSIEDLGEEKPWMDANIKDKVQQYNFSMPTVYDLGEVARQFLRYAESFDLVRPFVRRDFAVIAYPGSTGGAL